MDEVFSQLPRSVSGVVVIILLYIGFQTVRSAVETWLKVKRTQAGDNFKRESDDHIRQVYTLSLESNQILKECALVARDCVELHKSQAKFLNEYFMSTVQFREHLNGQIDRLNDRINAIDLTIKDIHKRCLVCQRTEVR